MFNPVAERNVSNISFFQVVNPKWFVPKIFSCAAGIFDSIDSQCESAVYDFFSWTNRQITFFTQKESNHNKEKFVQDCCDQAGLLEHFEAPICRALEENEGAIQKKLVEHVRFKLDVVISRFQVANFCILGYLENTSYIPDFFELDRSVEGSTLRKISLDFSKLTGQERLDLKNLLLSKEGDYSEPVKVLAEKIAGHGKILGENPQFFEIYLKVFQMPYKASYSENQVEEQSSSKLDRSIPPSGVTGIFTEANLTPVGRKTYPNTPEENPSSQSTDFNVASGFVPSVESISERAERFNEQYVQDCCEEVGLLEHFQQPIFYRQGDGRTIVGEPQDRVRFKSGMTTTRLEVSKLCILGYLQKNSYVPHFLLVDRVVNGSILQNLAEDFSKLTDQERADLKDLLLSKEVKCSDSVKNLAETVTSHAKVLHDEPQFIQAFLALPLPIKSPTLSKDSSSEGITYYMHNPSITDYPE